MLLKDSQRIRGRVPAVSKCTPSRLIVFFVILLSTFLVPYVHAQDAVGTLEGLVSDNTDRPIVGATLALKNLETNSIRTQVSNEDGRYRFALLSVGHYSLTADAASFAHFSQSPIEITISQTTQLNVSLVLATVQQSITVEGAAPAIDTSTNTLGKVVSSQEVLDLPLNGRNRATRLAGGRGATPCRTGHRRWLIAIRSILCREWTAPGRNNFCWMAQNEPDGWRICAEDSGRCHLRVSHSDEHRAPEYGANTDRRRAS